MSSKNAKEFQINDLWQIFWHNKKHFIISLILCCGIAVLYILATSPEYSRTASVMLREESKGGGLCEYSALGDLSMFYLTSNVNNEVEVFCSPLLMEQVIKRLQLQTYYQKQHRLRSQELYGRSPVDISFLETTTDKTFSFRIRKISEQAVELENMRNHKEKIDVSPITVNLNEPTMTPIGQLIIKATDTYQEDFDKPITVTHYGIKELTDSYLDKLQTTLANRQSSIIELGFSDPSPKRAEDILNTLIDVYNEEWIAEKNRSAVSTSRFLMERLNIIEKELKEIDSNIENYKVENQLVDVQMMAKSYMEESGKYNSELFEVNNQLAIAEYVRTYLNDSQNKYSLLPGNSGLNSLNIEKQINDYNTLLLRRNRLVENSSDNNPLVKDMEFDLLSMHYSIGRTLEQLITSFKLHLEKLEKQELKIAEQIASNPEQERFLLTIERQQKIKESLYLYLLQKQEENELTATMNVTNTRVIRYASGKPAPVAPQKSKILLLAIVAGLILPYLLIRLRETLNTTVRSKEDLAALTIPFLGEIPQDPKSKQRIPRLTKVNKKDEPLEVVVQEQGRDLLNEAFRVVRTHLDFMIGRSQQAKVIMLTSFLSGSGKSFISLNLAKSMAVKGKKVLLIDLDLRKRALSNHIGKYSSGISSYLNNHTDSISDITIYGKLHPCLDIIPVGIIPPNPSELLLGGRLDKLLKEVDSQYDYIFIDTVPIQIVADTIIIAKSADLTLFIIRAGLMELRMLPDLEAIYQEQKFKDMAVILNGISHVDTVYGYGYGHGYIK